MGINLKSNIIQDFNALTLTPKSFKEKYCSCLERERFEIEKMFPGNYILYTLLGYIYSYLDKPLSKQNPVLAAKLSKGVTR